jgi:hypothetical protein
VTKSRHYPTRRQARSQPQETTIHGTWCFPVFPLSLGCSDVAGGASTTGQDFQCPMYSKMSQMEVMNRLQPFSEDKGGRS